MVSRQSEQYCGSGIGFGEKTLKFHEIHAKMDGLHLESHRGFPTKNDELVSNFRKKLNFR